MPVVSLVTVDIVSQCVYLGILKILSLSQLQHLSTIGSRKELSLTVEQFQRVPLAWVMAGGDDYAAIGAERADCEFGSRRGSQSDIHYVKAHSHQGATDDAVNHHTRYACVTTYDDSRTVLVKARISSVTTIATYERSVCCCKLYDI